MEKIVAIALVAALLFAVALMVIPGIRGWEHYVAKDIERKVIDIQWEGGYYVRETYNGRYELYVKEDTEDVAISQVEDFADCEAGLVAVPIGENRKYGYINQEGAVIIAPVFDYAFEFSEGLAEVEVDGLWGYIDMNGEFVIEPQYYSCTRFMNGYATVAVEGGLHEGMSGELLDSGIWGLIDTSGWVVIKPQYDFLLREQDYEHMIAEKDEMKGLVDKDNDILIPFEYENMWFEYKSDGLYIWAEKADNFFYFDTKDPMLSPVKMDHDREEVDWK